MREIKFRGKSVETGKWEYGNLVITDHNRLYEMIDNERRYRGVIAFETVGQFTGLHDKNGKEIYEGDIIRNYGHDIEDWIVSYEYGKFIGTFDNICEDLYEIHDFEVIGNIYDNPELLGGKENENI